MTIEPMTIYVAAIVAGAVITLIVTQAHWIVPQICAALDRIEAKRRQ